MPLKDGSRFHSTFKLFPSVIRFVRLILVFLLCLASGGTRSFIGATTSDHQLITPDAAIVRELGAGEAQIFEISLSAGKLLQFSLEKGELRLSLIVYGPAGQKLLEQVSHSYEVLEISVPAEISGVYRLEIRSLEGNEKRRRIELKVAPIRTTSNLDLKDSAARRLMASASLLRAEWAETSFRQAIEKYREASLIWLSVRNLQNGAKPSIAAGEVYFTLGEYREALNRYKQAADEARRSGDTLTESQALSEAGRVSSYLGDNDAAQGYLERAINYYAGNGGAGQLAIAKHAYAKALTNLGEVCYSKGDLVKASRNFEHSLKLFTELDDRKGQARARLFAGYIAGSVGEPELAFGEISQALTLYREVGDKSGEGLSLTALGLSYSRKRGEEHAIKMHLEARDIFRVIGDRQSEAITLNALGQAYEHLRDYPLALDNYRQALKVFEANGFLDLAAVDLYQIAGINRLLGDTKTALSYYEQCIKLSRGARKTRMEAYALNEVAAIYASQRNRSRTYAQYKKILNFYRTIGDHVGQALALNNLGDFHLSLGDQQKALSNYKQALPLSQRAGERGVEISTLYNLARASRDNGALDEALSYIRASIKIIEEIRTNVASPDFRTSYFAGLRRNYDLYIEILMKLHDAHPEQGFAVTALLASESARARTLVEILTEARADIRQDVDIAVLKRERELQALLQSQAQYQMELSSGGASQTEAAEVASQIDILRAEYQGIQAQLRDQNPRLLMLTQPPTLSLQEIQRELGDGNTILLEYALGDEKSYLWVVTVDSVRSYELPSRATLEDAAREVYKLVTSRQGVGGKIDAGYQPAVAAADDLYYEKALSLSRMLLGQALEQLGNKRLVIVTEGVLQYVPLDALPTPAGPPNREIATLAVAKTDSHDLPPLIAAHEIITLPSMSTLAAIRLERPRASSRNKVVAVLADPVFSADDDRVQIDRGVSVAKVSHADQGPDQLALRDFEGLKNSGAGGPMRLTHTSEEADAILAAAPPGVAMAAKGFDASRETAMSAQVAQYQILHLATHGFINSEHPELSGIVLTMVNRDGSEAKGFLQLHDIYNLKLSANLTVLSACDTALGKDIKGEGLIGLTRGFMHAGSRSVVASLWKVDDRATAALMGYFYKAMLQDGLPPAAALRSAKETMRHQSSWRAPYFWAGFVLQGEYNQTIKVNSDSPLGKYLTASLAVGAILLGLLFLKWRRSRVQPSVRPAVQ